MIQQVNCWSITNRRPMPMYRVISSLAILRVVLNINWKLYPWSTICYHNRGLVHNNYEQTVRQLVPDQPWPMHNGTVEAINTICIICDESNYDCTWQFQYHHGLSRTKYQWNHFISDCRKGLGISNCLWTCRSLRYCIDSWTLQRYKSTAQCNMCGLSRVGMFRWSNWAVSL
jgi:hypothetical protein